MPVRFRLLPVDGGLFLLDAQVSKSFPESVLAQYHLMNVEAPRFLHVSQSLTPQSHEVSTTSRVAGGPYWYFLII